MASSKNPDNQDITSANKSYESFRARLKRAVMLAEVHMYCNARKILLDLLKEDYPEMYLVNFALGRIYAEQGGYEQARKYLMKSVEAVPELKNYALKLLVDAYMRAGMFKEAVETARLIDSYILASYSTKAGVLSLLYLRRDDEAKELLASYVKKFPGDIELKMTYAALLNSLGEIDRSIDVYRDVYLDAAPQSQVALNELRVLEADNFSVDEMLRRAKNLYRSGNYKDSERTFNDILDELEGDDLSEAIFISGMCQFQTKRYSDSAVTFRYSQTPKWMYWRARSFYRNSDMEGFNNVRYQFEELYPDNKRLALLYLMEADELRREGNIAGAAKGYQKVIDNFPENEEDGLWGLGWLYYTTGKYAEALNYFSRLVSIQEDNYKYLYWKTRSLEKLSARCGTPEAESLPSEYADICERDNADFFDGLPSDRSFYGYLIKNNSSVSHSGGIKILAHENEAKKKYRIISDLLTLGMRDELIDEIAFLIRKTSDPEELLYLGSLAIQAGVLKEVIAFAEPRDDEKFLPYSYPLAFRKEIENAAEIEGVDKYLIAAVIREESRFDPYAISWAGAIGLMQLMPSTAERMNRSVMVHFRDSSDLYDISTNISLGAHYLANLAREFSEVPFAIAAYNAGENAIKRWLDKYFDGDWIEFIENIPYKETRRYVKKVLKSYWQYKYIYESSSTAELPASEDAGTLATARGS